MKTTAIYYDNFFNIGAPELLEECRYGKEERLTGYKFKKHLWYSFLWELQFLPAEGFLYMTIDGKAIFSAIVENGKATVYLHRNGQRFEYRTFKVR